MGSSLLNISVSGMRASQVAMQTVQHNVSNANTEGYNRQLTNQASALAFNSGGSYIGTGTKVETVSRLYDEFLTSQVNRSQTTLSALEATSNQMESIDQLLADPTAGLAPALQDFFTNAQQVGAYPSSVAARQSMVSSAQVLVNRFNVMNDTIGSLNDQINIQITTDTTALNDYAKQLAELNGQVTRAGANGNAPNDLLDKRDQVVMEMNKLANISVTKVTNDAVMGGDQFGSYQVYVGTGHLLVSESGAKTVSTMRSSDDPERLTFAIDGNEISAGDVTGGSLGGLLTFRNDVLNKAQNSLGQVAYSLASTFNAQHETGMDLLGNHWVDDPANPGTNSNTRFAADFFTINSTVSAVGSPSTSPQLTIDLTNPVLTGNTTADYYKTYASKSDYSLQYTNSSGSYTLTRESDGKTWSDTSIANLNTQITTSGDEQGFTLNDPGLTADATYKIRPMADMASQINVNQSIVGDVRLLAAGLSVKAGVPNPPEVTGTNRLNTGTMSATVSRMSFNSTDTPPVALVPNLIVPAGGLELTYDAASNTLNGFGGNNVWVTDSDGVTTGPSTANSFTFDVGATYNVGGVIFSVTGAPDDTDRIILSRNDGTGTITDPLSGAVTNDTVVGVSDSSNLLLLAQMESKKVLSGASTYGGAYAQMVADVGNDTASYKLNKEAQQSIYDLSISRRDSLSGVNLDEEAANLMYYQQMYQANAKALQAGQKLFDTLLSIMN